AGGGGQSQYGNVSGTRNAAGRRRQDGGANHRVPAEEGPVQKGRGADERAGHRRKELPEAQAAAHRRRCRSTVGRTWRRFPSSKSCSSWEPPPRSALWRCLKRWRRWTAAAPRQRLATSQRVYNAHGWKRSPAALPSGCVSSSRAITTTSPPTLTGTA